MTPLAGILAVYATQVAAGCVVLATCGRAAQLRAHELLARALLLGPAALALELFLFHHLGIPFRLDFALSPWWVLLVLMRRRLAPLVGTVGVQRGERLLLAIAGALFASSFVHGLLVPVHRGDGMFNFAVVARIFETERSLAPETLLQSRESFETVHPEYPPLVALGEALVFAAAGAARSVAIKPFFALAGLALWLLALELALRYLRPRFALPAALLFLLWPAGYEHATSSFADLRLTASILLAVVEAERLVATPNRAAAYSVALALGTCALTKNEGLALALLGLPGFTFLMLRGGVPGRARARALASLCALALVWPLFRASHGLADPYFAGALGESPLDKLPRIAVVLAHFAALPFERGVGNTFAWGVLWPVTGLCAVTSLAVARPRRPLLIAVALLAVHVLLYVAAMVLTPVDLAWHLETAAPRLLMHTYPLLFLVCVTALAGLPGAAATQPELPSHPLRGIST